MKRRDCLKSIAAACGSTSLPHLSTAANTKKFALNYSLSTEMYGNSTFNQILTEFEHTETKGLNIASKPHGTQRHEIDEIGIDTFVEMLQKFKTKVTAFSHHQTSCFDLQSEMPILEKAGGNILICRSPESKELTGKEAQNAVTKLIEEMIPHADKAAEHGITIAIANHSEQVINHPDTLRYFAEQNRHPALGIALAPQHLHDHIHLLPELILELGDENIPFMYFQEFGDGAYYQLQKQIELEQLPGRGSLDYTTVARALKYIEFSGVVEISMHTTPRGKPVLENIEDITELVNEAKIYVDSCIDEIA